MKRHLALLLLGIASLTHAADEYPLRPIRLVVPTGAGGITDILARIVADKIRPGLGQQVVVDNRTGASGIIGSDIVAKSNPDGYTLLMVFPTHPVNLSLYRTLPYDTLKDFAPVTLVSSVSEILLVHPSSPARSVQQLVAMAKAKPGELNYGSVGAGSLGHLSAELFAQMAGIQFTHIAYKGAPQVQTAILGGEIQVSFGVPITSIPAVRAGKLRALGVSTRQRLPLLPDVPTIDEAGVRGYEVTGWNGILAPAKTPRAIVERLNREIVKVLKAPDVLEQLAAQGADPVGNTPAEFDAIIRTDIDKWAKVIRTAGIKAQ